MSGRQMPHHADHSSVSRATDLQSHEAHILYDRSSCGPLSCSLLGLNDRLCNAIGVWNRGRCPNACVMLTGAAAQQTFCKNCLHSFKLMY